MSTTTTRAEVAGYVAKVREHLSDLDAEVVEELTGGLEADLSDALDGDTATAGFSDGTPPVPLVERFGDSAAYAAELRSSAGLPPAEAATRMFWRERTTANARAVLQEVSAPLRRQPWWPAARDFFVVLRPAWWVLRGVVLVAVPVLIFGMGTFALVVLGALAVVLSVEVGRRTVAGTLLPSGGSAVAVHNAVVVANVVAAAVALPLLGAVLSASSQEYADDYGSTGPYGAGVVYNSEGNPVQNVFPYDAAGKPLTGVRLLDQDGVPIEVNNPEGRWDEDGTSHFVVPSTENGGEGYDVFPLRETATQDQYGADGLPVPATTGDAPLPRPLIQPLLPEASASASASAGTVTVPDVLGQKFPAARETLQAAGLVAEASPPGDTVIGVDPAVGVQVAPGTVVRLTLKDL